jgi:6-pyruvoyltetrahydropterin/6-carboxytetrahydropterin synthase
MQYVFIDYSIDCAHWLPRVPSGHKCHRLHGHRYQIRLEISGSPNNMGWILDYAEIKEFCDPIIMGLDHRTLNDIPDLENPTCENIVIYLRDRIRDLLFGLCAIEVRETDGAGSGWRK